MSQEQTNIFLGERGFVSRRDGQSAEKAMIFHNFLKMSQGLLASIVVLDFTKIF